jgi:hypothetical protein
VWVFAQEINDGRDLSGDPLSKLFGDARLERDSPYLQIVYLLRRFLDTQPKFGPENQNLVDMLRSPAVAAPLSLAGQLQYIREKWAPLLLLIIQWHKFGCL